jgi:hypothetical protein
MPLQIAAFDRRDNADRADLGNAAFAFCKSVRASDGVNSSKFYWYGADTIVIITDAETSYFESPAHPDVAKNGFALTDLARMTLNWRLADPRAGQETYQKAGR